MKKLTVRCNKFKIRIRACWNIIFRNSDHWMLLNLNEDNLYKLLKEDDFDVDISYHGLQPFVCKKIIKSISENIDFSDMVMEKAIFEAKSETFKKKRNLNEKSK